MLGTDFHSSSKRLPIGSISSVSPFFQCLHRLRINALFTPQIAAQMFDRKRNEARAGRTRRLVHLLERAYKYRKPSCQAASLHVCMHVRAMWLERSRLHDTRLPWDNTLQVPCWNALGLSPSSSSPESCRYCAEALQSLPDVAALPPSTSGIDSVYLCWLPQEMLKQVAAHAAYAFHRSS
jgi:hypothetical protein